MKDQERLSIAQLKAFKGFEDISDDEAEDIISSLEVLSILFYELHQKLERKQPVMIKLKGDKNEEKRNAA